MAEDGPLSEPDPEQSYPDEVSAMEEAPFGEAEPYLAEGASLENEPKGLGPTLVDLGLLGQEDLDEIVKNLESAEREYLDPVPYIDPRVLRRWPEAMATEQQILPLAQVEGDPDAGRCEVSGCPVGGGNSADHRAHA